VDVRVLEAGQHHPPGQMVVLGRRADQIPHLLVGAHGDNALTPDSDRRGPAPGLVDAVDVGPGDDHVGVPRHTDLLGSPGTERFRT